MECKGTPTHPEAAMAARAFSVLWDPWIPRVSRRQTASSLPPRRSQNVSSLRNAPSLTGCRWLKKIFRARHREAASSVNGSSAFRTAVSSGC